MICLSTCYRNMMYISISGPCIVASFRQLTGSTACRRKKGFQVFIYVNINSSRIACTQARSRTDVKGVSLPRVILEASKRPQFHRRRRDSRWIIMGSGERFDLYRSEKWSRINSDSVFYNLIISSWVLNNKHIFTLTHREFRVMEVTSRKTHRVDNFFITNNSLFNQRRTFLCKGIDGKAKVITIW